MTLRIIGLLLLCAIPALCPAAAQALRNELTAHPSPYLAMHAQDPVHWQTWSAETLAKARALNRPLFISVGYFACHWCHVMQRESFQDKDVAELLNTAFVPVKVDRELRPALDAHLIDFVRVTRGHAGWPLNVILTPEGYPLVGMTYLPRKDFYDLLEQLQRRWNSDEQQLLGMAQAAMREWRSLRAVKPNDQAQEIPFTRQVWAQAERSGDDAAGGFGMQAKFPMVAQLQALLWLRENRDRKSLDDFIRLTLDNMADQGMHDLLGGGFFRYTTDPTWMRPHYEKMLYDNAQLACLYLQAGHQFDDPRYREIGLGTVDFMIQNMRGTDGYYISSFSAVDDEGREGYYYLWDDSDLSELLNDDELKAVNTAWFSAQDSGEEFGRLPRRQMSPAVAAQRLKWTPEKLTKILESARGKLLKARAQRSLPADDKGLAAWNGLALSALACAYKASGNPAYAKQAEVLTAYIMKSWWNGKRLLRARQDGKELAPATLEDYALVARGLWDWSQAKPGGADEKIIEQLLRDAWNRYFINNRWVQDDTPLIPMLEGSIALDDGPLPSASALLADLSLQLEGLRNDKTIQEKVSAHLREVRAGLGGSALWYASYVKLLDADQSPR